MTPRAGLVLLILTFGGCISMNVSSSPDGGSITLGRGASADSAARHAPPAPGPVPRMEFPQPEELVLENGLRVLLVRRPRLPLVHLELLLPGGARLEGAAEAGLAGLVADLLDEGTATRTSLEVAEAVERLGATLEAEAGWDALAVRLEVLRPRLEPGLEIMGEVVRRPAFRQEDVDRVLERRKTRVVQRGDQPAARADDHFVEALYGGGHPYGRPLTGTEPSLAALERDDVVRFHGAQARPDRATLIAAGDVRASELRALLETHLGGAWEAVGSGPPGTEVGDETPGRAPGGAVDVAAEPADAASGEEARADSPAAVHILLVDRPGAPQSEIRVGRVGVERATDDFHAVTVLNTLLGGAFTSRLNQRLREEKGYTYGAGSRFEMRVRPGPFVARTAVHTPVTHSAVADIVAEIRRLAEERVSDEELARARSYAALRLPRRFETAAGVADGLAEIVLHDLPADAHERFAPGVLAVSADEVLDAARRHMSGTLHVVVVGDRAAVEAPLRGLGLGEIRVVPASAPGPAPATTPPGPPPPSSDPTSGD